MDTISSREVPSKLWCCTNYSLRKIIHHWSTTILVWRKQSLCTNARFECNWTFTKFNSMARSSIYYCLATFKETKNESSLTISAFSFCHSIALNLSLVPRYRSGSSMGSQTKNDELYARHFLFHATCWERFYKSTRAVRSQQKNKDSETIFSKWLFLFWPEV